MTRDLRVCFVGDSLVAGVGDADHLGWVGRLCGRSHRAGVPLTAYNLGVRGQTSQDVRSRWLAECAQRLSPDWDSRVVVSFGVNDTTTRDGRRRVPSEQSGEHLSAVLIDAAAAGWPVLVVGPSPVDDPAQNELIAELDALFGRICADQGTPHVSVLGALADSSTWAREVAEGDGAHPSAAGYAQWADLVWPLWREWTAGPR
jgi:lysophospholipase L1-like esterase